MSATLRANIPDLGVYTTYFRYGYGTSNSDKRRYKDWCKMRVWAQYADHSASIQNTLDPIQTSDATSANRGEAIETFADNQLNLLVPGMDWLTASVSTDDATIKTILEAIGLWDTTSAGHVDTNCGRVRTVHAGSGAAPADGFSPYSAWMNTLTGESIVAKPAGRSCYCARVSTYDPIPMVASPDLSASCAQQDKTQETDANLCFYKSYREGQTDKDGGEHLGKEDLFERFVAMPGFESVCNEDPEHHFFRSSAYIHPSTQILKLKAFEDCLDVTFDWLYGPSDVTGEQQAYIRTREGQNADMASTVAAGTPHEWGSHYATGQHMSALGGRGRAAINALYGDNDNTFETDKWFDKLNGKWKDPVDSQLASYNAAPETVVSGTEQYSKMAWSRRAWATATGAWSPGNFPSSSSYWGLWQRYVHCELSESRTREKLLDEGTFNGGDSMSPKRKTYLDAMARDTLGVQRVDSPTGGWNSDGSKRHSECRGCPDGAPDASCTDEQKVVTECVESNPVYQWKSEDHDDDITVRVDDHCAYIHHNDTHVEKHCNDDHDLHRHVRCWDFYVMCSALQKRSESAYREWKTYREDECDMQEKCLTGFGRAVEVHNSEVAQTRDQASWNREAIDISLVNTVELQKDQDVRRLAIESRLAICSETCAIEHENALAREADNETAERLKCMLKALFGEMKQGTVWEPSENANGVTSGCASTADCKEDTMCDASDSQCKDITHFWDYTEKQNRRARLQTCSDNSQWIQNGAYIHHAAWALDQIECPSWSANQAIKQWWETNDNTQAMYTSRSVDMLTTTQQDVCRTRKGCGLGVVAGCADEEAICNIKCDEQKIGGCVDDLQDGWELVC